MMAEKRAANGMLEERCLFIVHARSPKFTVHEPCRMGTFAADGK